MSDDARKSGEGAKMTSASVYEVGYSKPPAGHRFQKGKSGNPKGRPKKAKADKPSFSGPRADLVDSLLMEEAYRMVTLREGEKVIELPAIQAVFRSMGVAAMKGNRHAQHMVTSLVRQIETSSMQRAEEALDQILAYKRACYKGMAQARALGRPEPEFMPHPDDVIVDMQQMTACIAGPRTYSQKRAWDDALAFRDKMQAEVSKFAGGCADPTNAPVRDLLQKWQIDYQRHYDRINDNLPWRYQARLEDRSIAPGATRPGENQILTWPRGDI